MKKFELTSETKINIFGKKLFRIKALISFGNVEAGETGGWGRKRRKYKSVRQCKGVRQCRLHNYSWIWYSVPHNYILQMQG